MPTASMKMLLCPMLLLPLLAGCSADEFGGSDAGSTDTGARDAPLDSEASLPPREFRWVFLTSTTHDGVFPPEDGGSILDGRSGADAFCTATAEASPLAAIHGRRWVAWLSWAPESDARDRLPHTASGDLLREYRLVDGVTSVFPKGFNFDVLVDGGPPLPTNPIAVDERANVLSAQTVWTGTLNDGRARPSDTYCGGWNASDPATRLGALGVSNDRTVWSFSGNAGAAACNLSNHLYCFEVDP